LLPAQESVLERFVEKSEYPHPDVDTMAASAMALYARMCAATLAHARSGDRIAIASHLGNSDAFDRAVADFAAACADQNQRDDQALADAVKSGRLEAQTGL
jgi:hypothetical protein